MAEFAAVPSVVVCGVSPGAVCAFGAVAIGVLSVFVGVAGCCAVFASVDADCASVVAANSVAEVALPFLTGDVPGAVAVVSASVAGVVVADDAASAVVTSVAMVETVGTPAAVGATAG